MITITNAPFTPGTLIDDFTRKSGNAGAIASFIGRVRGESGCVDTLYLESYKDVTEAGMREAEQSARKRWPLADVLIVHRTGLMSAGEPIVLVCTASEHRRAAFQACDFLMDYLKTKAIFWKKQTGPNGEQWIEPRQEDYQDSKRWSKTCTE